MQCVFTRDQEEFVQTADYILSSVYFLSDVDTNSNSRLSDCDLTKWIQVTAAPF